MEVVVAVVKSMRGEEWGGITPTLTLGRGQMGLLQRLWLGMRLHGMCTLGVSVAPESAERPRALSLLATWFLRAALLALTSPSARHALKTWRTRRRSGWVSLICIMSHACLGCGSARRRVSRQLVRREGWSA